MNILPKMVINLQKLAFNYNLIKQYCTSFIVGAVIKSNAYGLGRKRIFETLFAAGCRHFYLADWQEILDLPQILIKDAHFYALSGVPPDEYEDCLSHNVVPVLHRIDQVQAWIEVYGLNKKSVLQINTGLNRLGLTCDTIMSLVNRMQIDFILHQLVAGYDSADPYNYQQISELASVASMASVPASYAASCGILYNQNLMELNSAQNLFNCTIRAGRALYGIKPPKDNPNSLFSALKPIAELTACIIEIRSIKAKDIVGYDHKFIAEQNMQIAVLNIGYSSGYHFIKTNLKQFVYYKNSLLEIISQSMDFTTIDLAGVSAEIGDYVELFGDNLPQYSYNMGQIIIPNPGSNIVYQYLA